MSSEQEVFRKFMAEIGSAKYANLLLAAGLEAEHLPEQLDTLDDTQLAHALSVLVQWIHAFNAVGESVALKMSQAVGKIVRGEIRLPRAEDVAFIHDILPKVLPSGWALIEERVDGNTYKNDFNGAVVLVSAHLAEGNKGKRWIHFSASFRDRLPTHEEMVTWKEIFLGQQTKAISVIPPRREYVNIHPNVLHLWCCLDGDGLPDFTLGSGSL